MENKRIENTLLAIAKTRCPRCREANMFKYGTWNSGKFLKMHRFCPNCGQDFIPEPGFYFGGMYYSYALNIALMVFFGLGFYIIFRPTGMWAIMLSVLIPPTLLAPKTFRVSRALTLYTLGGVKRLKKVENLPSQSS